ncbi:MAG: FHA domain-containing protein, partial [Patulibacter sp.]|nr:FHA domain-containing protein [Patulibacter sp.]
MTEPKLYVLRDIESKLAGLVEGTFGRLFRSEVTPAELARGLAREMEATRRQGVDRTWAAPHYDVFLSPADHRKLAPTADELTAELSNSLLLHAREQRFALSRAPVVELRRGDELGTGRYGVRAIHADRDPRPAADSAPRAERPERPAPPRDEAPPRPAPDRPSRRDRSVSRSAAGLVLVHGSQRELVPANGGTIGRSRDCDVVIASAEVSREHAEIRPADASTLAVTSIG